MPESEHDEHVHVNKFSVDLTEDTSKLEPDSMTIEKLAEVVMAEASQDAEKDLKDTLREMEETNKKKKALRRIAEMGAGVGVIAILIGLLVFLPAEGLKPILGMGSEGGQSPCPGQDSELPAVQNELPAVQTLIKFLSDVRVMVGSDPLCNSPIPMGGGSTGGGQTGGAASGCSCVGVDTICKNADGSIASVSYNAVECGGSGQCECRDPNKTLACPDGTYADFNPQCGVGGSTGGSSSVCGNQLCEAGENPNNCLADCP